MNTKNKSFRVLAAVLIAILILCICGHVFLYFQTYEQLVSPLISNGFADQIAFPFLYAAILYASLAIIALILFWNKKYLLALIIAAIGILMQYIHPHLIFEPLV